MKRRLTTRERAVRAWMRNIYMHPCTPLQAVGHIIIAFPTEWREVLAILRKVEEEER